MKYDIKIGPQAEQEIESLRADLRARVRDAIERHLRYEPTRESRSRIKRLRDTKSPQYRLRVDLIRVFYDVIQGRVEVIGIMAKSGSIPWLKEKERDDDEKSDIG